MYLRQVLADLIERGVTSVPKDVELAISQACAREKSRIAKVQLSLILRNMDVAKSKRIPLCQDTGLPVFYVRVGRRCAHVFDIKNELEQAVGGCTLKSLLRPNVVDPMSRENSGDNSGKGVPIVHYELFDGDYIDITFVPRGAGTENMGKLLMLRPGESEREIEKNVLGHVRWMGGKPCPPYILGIGIGGTSERCMELAKLATIRPLDKRNCDLRLARLERRLLKKINDTGIGPMGLGGRTTCLGVSIEAAACHTATMPVALAVSCWAARRSSVRLHRHMHTWTD